MIAFQKRFQDAFPVCFQLKRLASVYMGAVDIKRSHVCDKLFIHTRKIGLCMPVKHGPYKAACFPTRKLGQIVL